MFFTQKLFPADKNYLLIQAQEELQVRLLSELIGKVIRHYHLAHNPLGLVDDTIRKIDQCKQPRIDLLHNFYFKMAAVYRYQYGEVQLEFLFDGRTHEEKYREEWEQMFFQWTNDFLWNYNFIRAVLELAVFQPPRKLAISADGRMNYFLQNQFQIKVLKRKGIMSVSKSMNKC